MIRKNAQRLSDEIMRNQASEARWRSRLIAARFGGSKAAGDVHATVGLLVAQIRVLRTLPGALPDHGARERAGRAAGAGSSGDATLIGSAGRVMDQLWPISPLQNETLSVIASRPFQAR